MHSVYVYRIYYFWQYKLGTDHLTWRGGGGGGYGFLFRSEFFFRTMQELEYLFSLSRKARIFFPEFNIRLYDKNSESDFFFLHQNQNIFFSNIGNQNIFLEKNHNPPFKLNGPSLIIVIRYAQSQEITKTNNLKVNLIYIFKLREW
jgi:hypothetical protein